MARMVPPIWFANLFYREGRFHRGLAFAFVAYWACMGWSLYRLIVEDRYPYEHLYQSLHDPGAGSVLLPLAFSAMLGLWIALESIRPTGSPDPTAGIAGVLTLALLTANVSFFAGSHQKAARAARIERAIYFSNNDPILLAKYRDIRDEASYGAFVQAAEGAGVWNGRD